MITFFYFLIIFKYVYLFLSSSDVKIIVIIYMNNPPLLSKAGDFLDLVKLFYTLWNDNYGKEQIFND